MTLLKQKDISKKTDQGMRYLCEYNCNYCGTVFEQEVYTVGAAELYGEGKHNITDQVVCPHCSNFLKSEVRK